MAQDNNPAGMGAFSWIEAKEGITAMFWSFLAGCVVGAVAFLAGCVVGAWLVIG